MLVGILAGLTTCLGPIAIGLLLFLLVISVLPKRIHPHS
jgi:hypothetical protein